MRHEVLSQLTPFDCLIIATAASNGFECVARLAVATHTSPVQKAHDVSVWFMVYEQKLGRIAGNMPKNGKLDEKFEFRGFVNIRLSDQDKGVLNSVDRPLSLAMEDIGGLIYSGYKLSIAYDRYSGAQQVTLTCVDAGCANYGYAISARHPDLAMALNTLLYKHFDLAAGDWTSVIDAKQDRSWD